MTLQTETREASAGVKRRAPAARKTGYMPTLDGWRTVAVFGVILFHAPAIVVGGHNLRWLQDYGNRGVQLFFAISGVLICSRLLEEKRTFGRISLQGFYLRRLFRIQPAAVVFLAFIGLLGMVGLLHTTRGATLSAVFSYRNFYTGLGRPATYDDRFTTHFWSLAVEEHFYLLLPALLVVAGRRLVPVLGALTAIFLVWPPVAHRVFGMTENALSQFRTDLALRDLLAPALLAVLLTRPRFRAAVERVTDHGLAVVAVLLAAVATEMLGGGLTSLVTCLGFPCAIVGTMLHPTQTLGRLLESRVMTWLGRLSYSLYLWQEIFFVSSIDRSPFRVVDRFPINLICALVCAAASYYFVEKPMIRLGHRFAPPATPGRADIGRV